LKFSNVIMATVSLVLMFTILDSFLLVAFIPLNSSELSDTSAFIISLLVASLVVGYVFALKIQEESRIKAIGAIVVLSAFTLLMGYSIWIANPSVSPWSMESLNSMFNITSTTPNYDRAAYSSLSSSLITIIGLVLAFIGLYAGSMLKKPSTKTKE
jgi:ABC-type uncharacterized transport system permease subunit